MTESKISQLSYPRITGDNFNYRESLIRKCKEDPIFAQDVRDYCAKDIVFWIENFCWAKDPRKKPEDVTQFILYDAYQIEFIKSLIAHIEGKKDLLIEKSRDMGASWMVLFVLQHRWLFRDGSDYKVGSWKEPYVDRAGDMDTLFEKLRFNLQRQPKFLMPNKFVWGTHSTYMKLVNPDNGNTIVGEAMTSNFGSGGRREAVLFDEFSKVDRGVDSAAWNATADVTPCRIVVATPVGSENKYATLAQGTSAEKIDKITLHWSLHPDKAEGVYYFSNGEKIPIDCSVNRKTAFELWQRGIEVRSPWYDVECERRTKQNIAQELDINYLSSGNPFFDLKTLSLQRIWASLNPKARQDPIPYGRFIAVNLVDVDNKVTAVEDQNGCFRLFERPDDYSQYVIGADSSEGLVKGDESYGVIRDKATRNVVCSFNGLWKPEVFAQKIRLAEKFYSQKEPSRVLVAAENNNMGYATVSELESLGSNLYWCMKEAFSEGTKSLERHKPGFSTTSVTRPLILTQGEEEIRKNVCEVRDEIIIQQMKTFAHNAKSGKAEASGDFHDDGVMAWLIAGYVISTNPFKAMKESNSHRESMQKELVRSRKNAGYSYA